MMLHPTVYLSQVTGVPEPSLRLLMTILLGYPTSIIYQYVHSKTKNHLVKEDSDHAKEKLKKAIQIRNTAILISGYLLSLFFNGRDSVHSMVTIAVSYIICALFQKKRVYAVAGVWIFNSIYLLVAYFFMDANDYDISWTMTQCILCLRLMGFSLDFMDGQEGKKGNKDQSMYKNAATSTIVLSTKPFSFSDHTPLYSLPSFFEVTGYCYFPTSFLVGPQFSFSLYKQWLLFNYSANDSNEKSNQQRLYVLKCFTMAIIYLLLQQIIGSQFSTQYLLTKEYASLPLMKRMFIFWMSGKFVFTKYLGIWLLTEGATASFRLGYIGISSDGKHNFSGLINVNPIRYELATSINDIIGGFNINTNYWSKYYVFKRLKWMGSKTYSQIGTLAFLAIWHGFHLGYFVTFLMEFLDLMAESILRKWIKLIFPNVTSTKLTSIFAWFLTTTTFVYAGIGFDLLTLSSAWVAYKQVYFFGHILLVLILLSSLLLPKTSSQKKGKSE